jgi:hypothetical protein
MAERVRLRLQNAEEVIAKAKEQAIAREQQMQMLKEKGQMMPVEASILGCWQTIEQTVICNFNPNFAESKLGNYRTFFQSLTPDGYVFGQSVMQGTLILSGPHAGKPWPGIITDEVTGRITGEGWVRYRKLPKENKKFISNTAFSNDYIGPYVTYKMRHLPSLIEAHWQGWEMEGKLFTDKGGIDGTAEEFKAVRIENQIWI